MTLPIFEIEVDHNDAELLVDNNQTNLDVDQTTVIFAVEKGPAGPAGAGGGDASTNTTTSVDGEAAVFSGTTGKTLTRATGTGLAKLTSGVLGTATAGTDYYNPGGTDVAIADGGTGASTASAARTNLGAEASANKGVANGYAPLGADNKVPTSYLPASVMEYQGVWNASTNSPTLADGTGNQGDVYRVGTAGTRNLGSGSITFDVGDYVIYNGSVWEKSDTTDSVASVAGLVGTITGASLKTALALVKSDVGLGSVDNTADAAKAVLSATKLATARNINGVPFDGTANITVRDALTPEMFGAVGNGTTDDTTALQALFDAAGGRTVLLAAGKTYKHTAVISIDEDHTTIVGPGTLLATAETASAVLITGKYVTIDGPTIKLSSASTRYDEYEKQKVRVAGDYCTLRNVTIDTSASAGIFTMAAYFCYLNVTVKNTKADGFYTTESANNGVIIGCVAVNPGDDGFSVVSYSDLPACHHITNIGCRVVNGGARGFSVVGGQHVQIIGPRVEGSAAAGLYIASEGNGYQHTTNVTVSGGVLLNANSDTGVDQGAILVTAWDSRNVQYVEIVGLAVRDCRTSAPANLGIVRYDTSTINDIAVAATIIGGPTNTADLGGITPSANRIYLNLTQNGIPFYNSRLVTTVTSAVNGTFGADEVAFIGAGGAYTLADAVGNSGRYTLKNTDSTNNTVTTTGGQTIDGSSSIVLTPKASVDLVSDGTNWRVI